MALLTILNMIDITRILIIVVMADAWIWVKAR